MKYLWIFLTFCFSSISYASETTRMAILLGYPGSGKGTLAQSLDPSRYVTFSFGDFLRSEVEKQTELGNNLKNEVEMKGVQKITLLPEDFIRQLFTKKIKELAQTGKHIVLDGYPKTPEQAIFLDNLLLKENIHLLPIYIKIDKTVLLDRILNRLICTNCSRVYNLKYNPPLLADVCDICSAKLRVRGTDSQENLEIRIKFFDEILEPLLSFYREESRLIEFDGNNPIEKTCTEFRRFLDNYSTP